MTSLPPVPSPLADLAVVIRSGVVESRHLGSIAALSADGSVAWQTGSGEQILPRSTVKPVQALACLLAGADIDGADLAIAAGSHTGEDVHVDVVRDLLTARASTRAPSGVRSTGPRTSPRANVSSATASSARACA